MGHLSDVSLPQNDIAFNEARRFIATGTVTRYDLVEIAVTATTTDIPKAGRASASTSVGELWVAYEPAEAGGVFTAVPWIVRTGMDTSAYTAGQVLYLGTSGALSATVSGATVPRPVARVLTVSSTVGVLYMDPQGLESAGATALGSATHLGGGLLTKSGTIANAAVRTLNATPVEMIAAPGAGLMILVERVIWYLDYATAGFDAAAAGDTLVARYTDGSGPLAPATTPGDTFGGATADTISVVGGVATAVVGAATARVNAPLVAHINSGEWYSAAGGSALRYQVFYRIVAPPL